MIVSDLSGAASAAKTIPATPPPGAASTKSDGAQASSRAGSQQDSVVLSPLASELKGDSLKVFSQLSTEDRSKLGNLVSSGAMSARDLGLALSSHLKQQRANTFWGKASNAVESLSGHASGTPGPLDISAEQMSQTSARRNAIKKSGMTGAQEIAAMQQMQSEIFGKNVEGSAEFEAAKRSFGNVSTPYFMSAGDERYVQSDEERQAGQRLNELGFKSEKFESAIKMLAEADVNNHAKENEKILDKIKSGSAS